MDLFSTLEVISYFDPKLPEEIRQELKAIAIHYEWDFDVIKFLYYEFSEDIQRLAPKLTAELTALNAKDVLIYMG